MFTSRYPVFHSQPEAPPQPRKRVLIATPSHSGQVQVDYALSLAESLTSPLLGSYEIGLSILSHEAVISRARNILAHQAIFEGYDRLMMVDADLSWTAKDLVRILTSESPIVAGVYPKKSLSTNLAFEPLDAHRELFDPARKSLHAFRKCAGLHADSETGEMPVKAAATGFMSVDVGVFHALISKGFVESYLYGDGTGPTATLHNFFPVRIFGGQLLGEDYSFCELARAAGFAVRVNTSVLLEHTGSHAYRAA